MNDPLSNLGQGSVSRLCWRCWTRSIGQIRAASAGGAGVGKRATYEQFTKAESAEARCHLDATVYADQVMLKLFGDIVDVAK